MRMKEASPPAAWQTQGASSPAGPSLAAWRLWPPPPRPPPPSPPCYSFPLSPLRLLLLLLHFHLLQQPPLPCLCLSHSATKRCGEHPLHIIDMTRQAFHQRHFEGLSISKDARGHHLYLDISVVFWGDILSLPCVSSCYGISLLVCLWENGGERESVCVCVCVCFLPLLSDSSPVEQGFLTIGFSRDLSLTTAPCRIKKRRAEPIEQLIGAIS